MRRGILAGEDIELLKGLSRPLNFSDDIEPVELYVDLLLKLLLFLQRVVLIASQCDNRWTTAIETS